MSKKVNFTIDRRYDKLDELERKLGRAFDDCTLLYEEDNPNIAKLRKEYDRLHEELYGSDPWQKIIDDTDRDVNLMDKVEGLIDKRPKLKKKFKGQTRDARALELEKDPELRSKILGALKEAEE